MLRQCMPLLIMYSSIVSMFPPNYRLGIYVLTIFLAIFSEETKNG